jgi:acyl transferase domain-containing protein
MKGASIGCYIGNFGEDWLEMMNKDPLTHGPYKVEGCADFMISNRISYEFDLKGPR